MTSTTLTRIAPHLVLCELEDTGLAAHESYSPFCLKVHRALRASGLAYERRAGTHPGSFAALNPAKQVPVLLVDDEPVSDSTQILARLGALGPVKLDGGRDPRVRAEVALWEELGDTALNGFLVAARWADDHNWPLTRAAYFHSMPRPVRFFVANMLRRRVVAALVARDVWRAGAVACWRRFESLLDALEARAPERGYWVGDAISAADLSIFAQLHGLRTDLTPSQRDSVATRRRLTEYLDRIDRETRIEATAPTTDASAPRGITSPRARTSREALAS